jgi:predicted phage baseplate assembly protein
MSNEELNSQDACGCCDGVGIKAPAVLYNRSGLSAIAYRIGTHSEVLASLQARLSSQGYPALAKLRTRDSDDFSIALLDAYACMADVLSFYQERIINESYLRTASERLSMSEMARLIGYRLRPGVAAETYLAFTLQEPPPQPPSSDPKQATGVPEKMTLDIGIKVQSIPGPDEKPQTFETIETIEARPEWNVLRPRLSQSYLPVEGRSDCWFQGSNLNIKAGDALLFIGNEFLSNSDKSRWQFRVINSVVIDSEKQRTQVSWSPALDSKTPATAIQAHLLRRRTAAFGHNAPMWATMPTSFKNLYEPLGPGGTHSSDWPFFYISALDGAVDMDALYADAKSGHWCVLTTGSVTALFNITSVSEVTRTQFALAGKVTRLMLSGDNYSAFKSEVRTTTVYTVSEQLTFAEAPFNAIVSNNDNVVLNMAIEGMQAGRKLMFSGFATDIGSDQVEVVTLKSVTVEDTLSKLIFENNLLHSYQRESLSIYANVALATHGETVHQILGSGAARLSHQRYTLKHLPLTYVGADNESGAKAALEVRVNDISWHETPTLYNAGANDRSYVLRVEEDGAGTIQFGNGRHGARLPTGQDNLRAIYRKGIGATGNLKAGQLSQLLSRPLGLKAVSNPLPADGGVDADSADHARRNMPLGVRTLGRVVSVQDYEDYARAYTGIAKAQATVLNTRAGRTVFISVAGDNGVQPPDSTLAKLLNALKQNGDPLVHCETEAYREATFHIGLRIKFAPDYDGKKVLTDVEAALRKSFSFDARDFGQIVSRSEVIAVAQEVEGVLGVDLNCFYRGTIIKLEERLTPAVATVELGNAIAAELLLLDTGPFDSLEEMP